MRNIWKKVFGLCLVIVMSVMLMPIQSQAAIEGGTCGEQLKWTFSEGILTISGTGEMFDYQYPIDIDYGIYEADTPWYHSREDITKIVVKEGVTSIGNNAFLHCSEVTSITLPESLTDIRESAFYNCNNLKEITIPENVTSIGDYAFSGCYSLTEIVIPENVTSIGTDAFRSCRGLTMVILPQNMTTIESNTFAYCSSLENITISENVTSIGMSAFNCCSSLKSLIIPKSVTAIGSSAFSECESLRNIVLPESLTKIGSLTFYGCDRLESVEIPQTVVEIGRCAFYSCPKLTDIYYHGTEENWNTIEIGEENKKLESVTFHYGMQSMPFTDISEQEWLYNPVKYAYAEEIMNGMTATTFEPNTITTRAMFIIMLYRLVGEPEVEVTDAFTDVPANAWYAKAVAWAWEEGVTEGTVEGIFSPDEEISRQQMAAMLYRYVGVENYILKTNLAETYPDGNTVSAWAWKAVGWAVDEGLINGKTVDGVVMLAPEDEARRSEAATIIMRFCEGEFVK